MRALNRNRRLLYYAQQKGREEIADENGNYTGEYSIVYTIPLPLYMNIGVEGGSWSLEQYGITKPNSRTLITDDMRCPLVETSVLWIDTPITKPFNYVVTSVSRSLNNVKITVERVENQ